MLDNTNLLSSQCRWSLFTGGYMTFDLTLQVVFLAQVEKENPLVHPHCGLK